MIYIIDLRSSNKKSSNINIPLYVTSDTILSSIDNIELNIELIRHLGTIISSVQLKISDINMINTFKEELKNYPVKVDIIKIIISIHSI